jgi:hypothetical protein
VPQVGALYPANLDNAVAEPLNFVNATLAPLISDGARCAPSRWQRRWPR